MASTAFLNSLPQPSLPLHPNIEVVRCFVQYNPCSVLVAYTRHECNMQCECRDSQHRGSRERMACRAQKRQAVSVSVTECQKSGAATAQSREESVCRLPSRYDYVVWVSLAASKSRSAVRFPHSHSREPRQARRAVAKFARGALWLVQQGRM